MGRNFDGVGIGFEFDDSKSIPHIKSMTENLNDLWGSVQKAGNVAGLAGAKMKQGFGRLGAMGTNMYGRATGAVQGMIESATSPQLDSAYSSMYATFNKSFSAMVAGMDLSSQEAKKMERIIGGVAFSLNEDMDGAAKTWASFRKQNVDLAKFLGSQGGTKGAIKDLIKVTSVFGIEGEQLSNIVAGLKYSFGFTEERVGSLADKIYVLGKRFKIGTEAIQAWPSIYEALNNELADFGKRLKPEEVEKLTLSVVQLGAGFKESMGMQGPAAMELARQLFTTIAGERKNIMDMARGFPSEFGEITKQLMETGGSVEDVFGLLLKGDPIKFMDMLSAMAKRAEETGGTMGVGFQRLVATMNKSIGADATFAMKGNWDSVREAMAKVPEELAGSKTKGALAKAANEFHKTGRTAGEEWEIMVEMMKTRLMKFSQKDVGKWKTTMKAGFKETEKTIGNLAKDDGPIGAMTRKLLLVQRVGLSGLLPAAKEGEVGLSGIAAMMGNVATQAFPMMTAMGSMGLGFGALGKMALAGGAVYGLFKVLQDGPDAVIKKVKNLKTSLVDGFEKNFPKLYASANEWMDKFRDPKFWGGMIDGFQGLISKIDFGGIFGKVGDVLSKIPWDRVFETAGGIGKGVAHGLANLLKAAFKNISFTDIGSFLVKALGTIGDIVTEFFATLFSTGGGEGKKKYIEAGFSGFITDAVVGALKLASGIVVGSMKQFWKEIFSADSLSSAFGKILKVFGIGLGGLMLISKKFRVAFLKDAGKGFSGIKKMAKGAFKILKTASPLLAIAEGAQQARIQAEESAKIMLDKTVKDADRAALVGERAFTGVANTLDALFFGIPSSIGGALGITSKDLNGFYQEMVGGFEKAITVVVNSFGIAVDFIKNGWSMAVDMISIGWDKIGNKADIVWLSMKSGAIGAKNAVLGVMDSIIGPLGRQMIEIRQTIENAMIGLQTSLFEKVAKLKDVPGLGWLGEKAESVLKAIDSPEARRQREVRQKTELDNYDRMLKGRDKDRADELSAVGKELAVARSESDALTVKAKSAFDRHGQKIIRDVVGRLEQTGEAFSDIDKRVGGTIEKSNELEGKRGATEGGAAGQLDTGGGISAAKKPGAGRRARRAEQKPVPTVDDRVALEVPRDMQTRGLLHSVNNLSMSVADFVKNPLNVGVNISGDVNKFLIASVKYEKRTAPSGRGM